MSSSVANYTEKRIRQVITPEGLSLPFTVASRGARIGALLLDLFFVQFALIAIFLLLLWTFTGLFDFSKPYRVTALFSGMTTGGAPLDAHLVISLPFISALFLVWRNLFSHTLGFLLLLLSLYGLAVTFSRIDYAAIAVVLLTGAMAWAVRSMPARNHRSVVADSSRRDW